MRMNPPGLKLSQKHFSARRVKAFSLVEVAMSLGLFAFGTLGLIGLLPVALSNHQEAKVGTVLAQISQRLSAEVMLTDAERLAALDGFVRAFDWEGRELANPNDASAVYRARIEIENFQAPGSDSASPSLRRAVIFAMRDPVGDKINSSGAVAAGSVLVARADTAPAP